MLYYSVITFIILLLYLRIFVKKESYIINEFIPYWKILLILSLLITLCYLLTNSIKKLGAIEPKETHIMNIMKA